MRRQAGGDVSLLPTASCIPEGLRRGRKEEAKNVIVQLAVVVNKLTLSRSVETNDERNAEE